MYTISNTIYLRIFSKTLIYYSINIFKIKIKDSKTNTSCIFCEIMRVSLQNSFIIIIFYNNFFINSFIIIILIEIIRDRKVSKRKI